MPNPRVLLPADGRTMPWKNGGGRTTEIAAHPPGAGLDAFDWRVSIADVEADGPFSAFPGVDRVLVLLEGSGFRLHGILGELAFLEPFAPLAFRGDAGGECTLVDGPVRDFNVMTRRGRARAVLEVVRDGTRAARASGVALCHAAGGPVECEVRGSGAFKLTRGSTLVVDQGVREGDVAIRPAGDASVALLVSIDPV